jgi:Skp family chaperone for outer membrane proteins
VKHDCGERYKYFFVVCYSIGNVMIKNRLTLLTVIATALIGGCSEDERLAKMAQDSVQQQRSQNEEMTRLNREVAQGVKRLVESENESRKELTGLQRDIQQQHADTGRQRDQLEVERRQLATERYRESLLAPVLPHVVLLVVCALPLVLAWYLLHGWRCESQDDLAIGELLIEELVSEQPQLLPRAPTAPAIGHRDQALLTEREFDESPDDGLG